MKKMGLLVIFLFCSIPIAGETTQTEKIKSQLEEWKETLLYGIADQMTVVIKEIRNTKELRLNQELIALFGETINEPLKAEILDFFTEIQFNGLETITAKLLSDYEEYNANLVIKSIKYQAAIRSPGFMDSAASLIDATDDNISIAVIQAIGELGNAAHTSLLLEKFNDAEFPDKRKSEIILTLGKIKAVEAVTRLIEIVENKDEDKIWRMYASDALGQIGNSDAIPVLKKLFSEDDALIRAYAASALARFKLPEVTDILIQGLKDANWKVRIQSAQGLADKNAKKAFEILKYKVQKDPVKDVQYAAIKAIGAIGDQQCMEFLRTLYKDEKLSTDIRDLALEMLLKYDLAGTMTVMTDITIRDLDKATGKSPIIELTAKRLFLVNAPELVSIFTLLLKSKNFLLRIYGIRGAVNNHFTVLKDQILVMSEKDPVENVKKEALSALSKF